MQEDKNKVETVLFTTGGFLGLEDIARLSDISDLEYLKKVVESLLEDYSKRDCALEVVRQGDKWKLSIRKGYLHLTEKLLKDCDLDRPTQETLAVVAYKNPALQSDVIKIRGNKAYDHITNLRDLDFITAEKYGRTRLLKVTQRFFDYFDVVAEQLKSRFENVVPAEVKEKLDKMSEESKQEALEEAVESKEISTEVFDNQAISNADIITKGAIIKENEDNINKNNLEENNENEGIIEQNNGK